MKKPRRRRYWTRERVIAALRSFYRIHKEAVTDHEVWGRLTRSTVSRSIYDRQFPAACTVLRHFADFYTAWEAAGVFIPARKFWSKDWSEFEDWYLIEACGLLSREQIAKDINRTPDAVHRRLYDLGINSMTHKGWTCNRLASTLAIPKSIPAKYRNLGLLPYVRGTKCLYHDPSDFLVIKEIDWNNIPEELETAVRRSLVTRAINAIQRAITEGAL
jgi:hypothetical protein